MQQEPEQDGLKSGAKRRRTIIIAVAHLLVVAAFFIASFVWGRFE